MQNRKQAIAWTNDGQLCWHIYIHSWPQWVKIIPHRGQGAMYIKVNPMLMTWWYRGPEYHQRDIYLVLDYCSLSTRGGFKNTYELLNLRAHKFSYVNKINIFQCMGKIFVWNFKGTLWNSTQNILPIHWKIWFLCKIEISRALRFKSS